MSYVKWAFWRLYYLFHTKPRDLEAFLIRGSRTRSPWWKFRPYVWFNSDGNYWIVWFSEEQDYSNPTADPRVIDVLIGQESGEVVGLKVKAKVPEALAAAETSC